VGGDHLRGDHPDRRRCGGDLARCFGSAWLADVNPRALSDVHTICRDPVASAHRDAGSHEEWRADAVADRDGGADGRAVTHSVQPGAGQLPDAAAAADADSQSHTDSDRRWCDSGSDGSAHTDAGSDRATELDAAADCDTDTVARFGLASALSAQRLEREEQPVAVLWGDR
jgi:hypothetical protein